MTTHETPTPKTPAMGPFCPLLVEEALCDPVGYDFFGQPANVKGIPSCDGCATVARMADDDGQWMIDMLKKDQPEALNEWGQLGEALALSFEETLQSSGPINEEYCWMHQGPGLGGWSCAHPECRSEER